MRNACEMKKKLLIFFMTNHSLKENDEDYMLLLPIFYHFDLVPFANLLYLISLSKTQTIEKP